jgi:hypothetical protein
MNGETRLRRFLIGGVLPVLAATLMLAGCGGGSSSSSAGATTSASATGTIPAALSAFQTCLKQHGVKIRPGQFGSGRPRASFTPTAFPTGSPRPRPSGSFFGTDSAAFKACAKYAPAGFGRGFGRTISASALAAFKSCLTQNGVKVTGKTAAAILAELRSATGKTAKAVQTCRVLLQPSAPSPSPST